MFSISYSYGNNRAITLHMEEAGQRHPRQERTLEDVRCTLLFGRVSVSAHIDHHGTCPE
jgi:hypothetical protein